MAYWWLFLLFVTEQFGKKWQLIQLGNRKLTLLEARSPLKVHFILSYVASALISVHSLLAPGFITFVCLFGCLLLLFAQLSGTFVFLFCFFLLLFLVEFGTVLGQLFVWTGGGRGSVRIKTNLTRKQFVVTTVALIDTHKFQSFLLL